MDNLIFAYGTLKKGFRNDHYLEYSAFVAPAVTTASYFEMVEYLYDPLGDWTYPAVRTSGQGRIAGEIYRVDHATLEKLDILEQEGKHYFRQMVELDNGLSAWMYLDMDDEAVAVEPAQNIAYEQGIYRYTGGTLKKAI